MCDSDDLSKSLALLTLGHSTRKRMAIEIDHLVSFGANVFIVDFAFVCSFRLAFSRSFLAYEAAEQEIRE